MLLKTLVFIAVSVNALVIDKLAPIKSMSPQLPAYFAGFSVEWNDIRRTFLKDSTVSYTPDQILDVSLLNSDTIKLLANFKQAGNNEAATVLIRIGGNSSIAVWVSGSNIPRLPLQTVEVSAFDLRIIDLVANITNAKLILNIGMPTAIPKYVGAVIDSWQTFISQKNIQAIEIGHEMDNAASRGFRPIGYTTGQYLVEFLAYQVSMQRRYSSIPNMGPSFGYRWRSEYQVPFVKRFTDTYTEEVTFTRGFTSKIKYFSFHRYGIKGCTSNTTLDNLLNIPGKHSYSFVSNYTKLFNGTESLNVWGEGASVSCGGKSGVSDVFGSALWALDSLLDMAFRGVGFSIMSGAPNKLYAPFTVDTNGRVFARPVYYGMLTFSTIMGGSNSSVYQASVNKFGTNTRLKAWAVFNNATKASTFIIIHKDIGVPFQVIIKSMGVRDGTTAQILELTSNSLTDLNGFTLGGLSYPSGVPGDHKETTVTAANGVFSFMAKPGTATIVRVNPDSNALPMLTFAQ